MIGGSTEYILLNGTVIDMEHRTLKNIGHPGCSHETTLIARCVLKHVPSRAHLLHRLARRSQAQTTDVTTPLARDESCSRANSAGGDHHHHCQQESLHWEKSQSLASSPVGSWASHEALDRTGGGSSWGGGSSLYDGLFVSFFFRGSPSNSSPLPVRLQERRWSNFLNSAGRHDGLRASRVAPRRVDAVVLVVFVPGGYFAGPRRRWG